MTKIYNTASLLLLTVFLAAALPGRGQELINTPAAYEQMKDRSLWMHSTNAAGSMLDKPIDYTQMGLSYDHYSGDFHRPQQGQDGNHIGFDVEGGANLKQLYTWGWFSYNRATDNGVIYNASILDPFRGMPYFIADEYSSQWRNHTYDMGFRAATPKAWGKLSFGLELSYLAVTGAKQRDLRTNNYFYTLDVKPGLVFSFNDKHHIGANFHYFSLKEDNSMSSATSDYYDYYIMYGLGTSVKFHGSGEGSNYVGNNVGGAFQYNYSGDVVNLLLSSSYDYKVEDVQCGFTTPEDRFTVKDHIWHTSLMAYMTCYRFTHYLTGSYIDRWIDGVEYVTKYDNTTGQNGYVTMLGDVRSTYKTQIGRLDYDLAIGTGSEYNWKMGIGAKYENKEDAYLVPQSDKTAENLAFQARLKKNFHLSDGPLLHRMILAGDYTHNTNLSGGYDYNGSHPEYITVTALETVDAAYLNSDYYSIGIGATYSQKFKSTALANIFGKVEYRYTKCTSDGFDNRNFIKATVGFNF